MENRNNRNEEMPKAQSMKAADKKHMILIYAGLTCWLLGQIFGKLRMYALGDIFNLVGLVLNCIGIYKSLKYRKLAKSKLSSHKQDK